MADNITSNSFVSFPSYIVPATSTPITKLAEREREIDDDLRVKYAKLEDIKSTMPSVVIANDPQYGKKPVSEPGKNKAYKTVEEKINTLEAKKLALYNENEQWKWSTQYMNAGISYYRYQGTGYDDLMYSYMDARVPEVDFNHITQLYAGEMGKALPAYIRQVNQIPATNNRIIGEADSMGIRYSVNVINSDAINQKLDEYAEKTAETLTRAARQNGFNQVIGGPLEDEDAYPVELPEEIEDMSFTNYKMDKEVMIKRGLDYLMKKNNSAFKHRFTHHGFRNYLGTGKMCFYVWDSVDDPEIKSIDSRNLFYIMSSDNPFIQNGTLAGDYFTATPQEVVDMCPEMSPSDVKKLKDWAMTYGEQGINSPMYINNVGQVFVRNTSSSQPLYLNCYRMNWRATKRVRVQVVENKYDLENPHLKYVDDKANETNASYHYRYVDEIWEGKRFGTDIFYQLRPVPGQHLVGDYVDRKTLNYVGIIDPNPSLNQLQQPFESLRIQAFYAIERMMAQTKGKVAFIDEASESDNADNHYNAAVYGTWKYNSAKEGDMQLAGIGGAKQINKPDIQDWGISAAYRDLMSFVAFLDMNVAQITGITGSRRGDIKSDTGLGQMEQANLASSMATQPYFTTYYTVIGQVLEKLAEQMQRTWGGKEIVKAFLGENGYELLMLMPETEWELPKYGISMDNGANDMQVQQQIYQLAQALMPIQTEPELALALIKIMNADSGKEAELIFEKGIQALKKVNKNMQMAQENEGMKMQLQQLSAENNALNEKLKKSNATVEAAQIGADAKIHDTMLKLDAKGEMQDSQKADKMDLLVADKELNQEEPEMENAQ